MSHELTDEDKKDLIKALGGDYYVVPKYWSVPGSDFKIERPDPNDLESMLKWMEGVLEWYGMPSTDEYGVPNGIVIDMDYVRECLL